MSLVFELEDQAKNDFLGTFEYYSTIDSDLAIEFSLDFDKSVKQILQFPDSGLPIGENLQRVLLTTFPHYIIYKQISNELIVCFAVGHTRRRPNYWND